MISPSLGSYLKFVFPLLSALIALMNLFGWASGQYRLLSPILGYPVMTVETAILILLISLSFICSRIFEDLPSGITPQLFYKWSGKVFLLTVLCTLAITVLVLPDFYANLSTSLTSLVADENLESFSDGASFYTVLVMLTITAAGALERNTGAMPVLLRNILLFTTFSMLMITLFFYVVGYDTYFSTRTLYDPGLSIYTWLALVCLFSSTTSTQRNYNYVFQLLTYSSTVFRTVFGLLIFLVFVPIILVLTNALLGYLTDESPQRFIAALVSTVCLALTLSALYISHLIRVYEQKLLVELQDKKDLIDEQRKSYEHIESLKESLVTVCAWSNAIKTGDQWQDIEEFLAEQLGMKISHGISPKEIKRQEARLKKLAKNLRKPTDPFTNSD